MIELRIEGFQKKYSLYFAEGDTKAVKRALRPFFYKLGKINTSLSRKNILDKKQKTGRVYLIRRDSTKRRHQASAAGEYPANISGNLRRSIDFNVRGADEMIFGASVPYANYLEKGTSKMAERPYLKKTVIATQRDGAVILREEIGKALTRLAKK